MSRVRLALRGFCLFLGLVVFAADAGMGPRIWGWLGGIPMGDKLGHCGLMFTLNLLVNLALSCRRLVAGGPGILTGTAIVGLIVVAEEFSQIWIPSRNFDLLDLTADFVGILAADLVARAVVRRNAEGSAPGLPDPAAAISATAAE